VCVRVVVVPIFYPFIVYFLKDWYRRKKTPAKKSVEKIKNPEI